MKAHYLARSALIRSYALELRHLLCTLQSWFPPFLYSRINDQICGRLLTRQNKYSYFVAIPEFRMIFSLIRRSVSITKRSIWRTASRSFGKPLKRKANFFPRVSNSHDGNLLGSCKERLIWQALLVRAIFLLLKLLRDEYSVTDRMRQPRHQYPTWKYESCLWGVQGQPKILHRWPQLPSMFNSPRRFLTLCKCWARRY